MTSENVDIVPAPEGPTGANADPPGREENIESALHQINTNMGTMTKLLSEVCARLPTTNARNEQKSSSRSPPGAEGQRRKRRSISVSSEDSSENDNFEPRRKSSKEDDSLSVHATDDDVAQLLAEQSAEAKATEKPSDNASEDEILKELVAALQDEDKKGPQVQGQLADIAMKRWGNKLTSEKITSILGKHPQPENCGNMAIARVNPEIWAPLNAAKRKSDLRLANMQQALQKATFAIVTTCDKLLAAKAHIDTKEMLTDSIDAIALVGHVVSELSSLRREQLRPSLKQEYHTICSNNVPTSSKLLFGDDLAKQIRDAKETSRIGHTVGVTKHDHNRNYRRHGSYQASRHDKSSKGGSRQSFLGKGYRSTARKKPYNGPKNETEKK